MGAMSPSATAYKGVVGDRKVWRGTLSFSNSYATNGDTVTPATFGFATKVEHVQCSSANAVRRRGIFLPGTNKFILYIEDGTSGIEAEAANAADLSGINMQVTAYGY